LVTRFLSNKYFQSKQEYSNKLSFRKM
jgi:hypothetical protein